MRPKIAVLPGDGIGPEVVHSALSKRPLDADVTFIDACADRYLSTGELVTTEEIAEIGRSDALLFGAIGDPRVKSGVLERGILLRLRAELDLYINLRPFPELDLVIVRENTEGSYAGVGTREGGIATETSVNTRAGIERCAEYAFELARKRGGHVTLVHKTNVLRHAGGLWEEIVDAMGERFPGVPVLYEHVDAAAYHLVRQHGRFDVILTDNMFGDILSDVAAAVGAGLGAIGSANLHPKRATRPTRCIGLFEPVHGSAPDIAGTGTADDSGMVAAIELMLDALHDESNIQGRHTDLKRHVPRTRDEVLRLEQR
ncbi:MAG TPA: isocitrate/isopropylmalate family dehydrogenase [Actinomycetota bacterium]|nr:isocitrate/isopropylmalate family dehydrogenase [Actinomycetota bacterium]